MNLNYTDVLFHVDSLGVRPSSKVVGMGLVPFNIETMLDIGSPLYGALSAEYQPERTTDLDSLNWWAHDAPYPLPWSDASHHDAVDWLLHFFAETTPHRVWFWTMSTCGVLHSLLDDVGREPPWEHHRLREGRTFCSSVYRVQHGHVMPTPYGETPERQLERRAASIQECWDVLYGRFHPVPEVVDEWAQV